MRLLLEIVNTNRTGTPLEVFTAFLQLGLTSFGGPIAHLGYFQRELVIRRRWVSEAQYAQLLALCQFLPGPSSSQLGFALGLLRAGWLGALGAFAAFTLPSALLLLAFAGAADSLAGPHGEAILHGLKLVAVAVVADGVRRMARQLTPDMARMLMAAVAAAVVTILPLPFVQLLVVAMGALLGQWLCRNLPHLEGERFALSYGPRAGALLLAASGLLLVFAFVISATHGAPALLSVSAGFYQAGALVFGGGHVVLPLLQQMVVEPGWITTDEFLAGYGAAQAVPGPMFSLAAFLGARLDVGAGAPVAAVACLAAIFLPGLLLVSGCLPWWGSILRSPHATRALAGINAMVVGLLAAALYHPVWTGAVHGTGDFAIVLIAFGMLCVTRIAPIVAVVWCIMASVLRVGFGS